MYDEVLLQNVGIITHGSSSVVHGYKGKCLQH